MPSDAPPRALQQETLTLTLKEEEEEEFILSCLVHMILGGIELREI